MADKGVFRKMKIRDLGFFESSKPIPAATTKNMIYTMGNFQSVSFLVLSWSSLLDYSNNQMHIFVIEFDEDITTPKR